MYISITVTVTKTYSALYYFDIVPNDLVMSYGLMEL